MEHAKDPKEDELDCLAAFHDSIHEYATVGDSILAFQDDFGYKFCEHCGVGIDKIMQCTACKTVSYCSSDCQKADWTNGGHKTECAAICGEHPWSQYANEFVETPVPSSVTARHYLRFAALVGAEQQPIEKIEGPHGGGFRGGSGGPGSVTVRPLSAIRPLGGVRPLSYSGYRPGGGGGFLGGFRRAPVLVYTRPYVSRGSVLGGGLLRWGGRGFGGHRYGFWPGWRFPWVYRSGLWFPWWFYINPVYYETGMPYVDPATGISYGVPPAAPGMWGGEVMAPPSGLGYTQPPMATPALMYADIQSEIVSLQDLSAAWTDKKDKTSLVEGETGADGNVFRRGLDKLQSRLSGKDKFERLMVARTKLMLHLTMSTSTSTLNALKKNAYEWGHHMDSVYGSVTRILRNNSNDQRTASDMLIDLLDAFTDNYTAMLDESRSAMGRSISQSSFVNGSGQWADFWTVMTIDPTDIPVYLTPESTLRDVLRVFKSFAPASRAVFMEDMNKYMACLIVHAKGHSAERHSACLEMAAELGKHIDERYNKAVGIKEEVGAQAEHVMQRWEQYKKDHPEDASMLNQVGEEFALIEADKNRKQEGKNLAGEKNSKRGPILYKKLTPKQRTIWGKWNQAKHGREIAESELRTFMSLGGKGDPDQVRSIRNRIEVNRKLEQGYKEQVDALIGPGRLVISVQIGANPQEGVEQIGGEEKAEEGASVEVIGSIFTKGKRRPTDEQVQARRDLELAQDELFEAERALEENKGSPIPKNEKALKNHVAAAKKRVENAQAKAKAANKRAKAAAKAPYVGPTRVIGEEALIGVTLPDYMRAMANRGDARSERIIMSWRLSKAKQALEAAKKTLEENPDDPDAQNALSIKTAAFARASRPDGIQAESSFETIEGFMDHFRSDPRAAARAAAQRDIDSEYAQLQRAKWELQRNPGSQRMQQSVAYMEQQLYAAQQRLAQIGTAILIVGGELLLDMQTEKETTN